MLCYSLDPGQAFGMSYLGYVPVEIGLVHIFELMSSLQMSLKVVDEEVQPPNTQRHPRWSSYTAE